jgi:hypothetical protein
MALQTVSSRGRLCVGCVALAVGAATGRASLTRAEPRLWQWPGTWPMRSPKQRQPRRRARCFSVSFAVSVTILTMLQVGDALLIGAASVTLVVLGATAFARRDLR